MKIIPQLLLCLLACFGSSCHLLYKTIKAEWEEAEVECASTKAMFEVSALALGKAGFPVGIGANPAKSVLVSGWRSSESPFKGRGYRERANVEFESLKPGWFLLRVRVERETNESFRPLDKQYAKWEAAPDSPESARRVLGYAQAWLRAGAE